MRKLNSIVLINAAAFDYVEFPVGGHTQVIGVNGHGKSTLLRTILFFYLGTNEKAPYALHETKADFVSHYLGDPPSYLIYEVSRSDGEPSFHIAVTRPAGRIQFHFVDAPFEKRYYVDGKFVRPIESVIECLREAHCASQVVGSYEDFIRRIYGLVPSQYTVFRPTARTSGQVAILPRIISGIFTVSQLDADKFKSALTCGVRDDAVTTELDLLVLKGQLENFRRVNSAVKTYLRHEDDAVALVEIADQLQTLRSDRQHTIEDLVRMAKRLPFEKQTLAEQITTLKKEQASAVEQFERTKLDFDKAIERLGKETAVLKSKIQHGEKIEIEYQQHEIERKCKELQKLASLQDEYRVATQEYESLTTKYGNEEQRKKLLLSTVQQIWADRSRCFADEKAACERKLRQSITELEKEKASAVAVIEKEHHDARAALQPRRKSVQIGRTNLNQDFSNLAADLKEPDELADVKRRIADYQIKERQQSHRQDQLRGQIELAKTKADAERERSKREAEIEQGHLQTSITKLEEKRNRVSVELEKFDNSLARFFQTEVPEGWLRASKTFSRETLFLKAEDLNARKAAEGENTCSWGVEFSTETIAEPTERYDRESLLSSLQLAKKQLSDELDKLQAARERYITVSSELDKRSVDARNTLESKIELSKEERGTFLNEIIRLDNRRLTLDSQWQESKKNHRTKLDQRDAALRLEEERIHQDDLEIQKRFDLRKSNADANFKERQKQIEGAANSELSNITADESAARKKYEEELSRIEKAFQDALIKEGVDPNLLKSKQERTARVAEEINRISKFQTEVTEYERLKREYVDPLPSLRSEWKRLEDSLHGVTQDRDRLNQRHQEVLNHFQTQTSNLDQMLQEVEQDRQAATRFREDKRFMQEWGYFEREDLSPAPFYRVKATRAFLKAAESTHETEAAIEKKGSENSRKFLNRFDADTLHRKVLGFSPIHEHFDWFIFVGSELKPFVNGKRIHAMRQIQTQEFEQLIRNITAKNSDFREGIRQVNQTASLVQTHLKENNFVDVLDSIEFKVERVDSSLTRTLVELEEFADLSFGGERDLFGKRADRTQLDRVIETFEKLLREIESHRGERLLLTDYFDFSIRVHENGHDMGWRRSLDHIGSTGTDYLVKMLIYLSLIAIFRERAIDSATVSAVHCVLDETGVIAPKYVRSVLEYAKARGIILITAGHSQQTIGFENWMQVRKSGQRFAAQTVLRKILKCD